MEFSEVAGKLSRKITEGHCPLIVDPKNGNSSSDKGNSKRIYFYDEDKDEKYTPTPQ